VRFVLAVFIAFSSGLVLAFQVGLLLETWVPQFEMSRQVTLAVLFTVAAIETPLMVRGTRKTSLVLQRGLLLAAAQCSAMMPVGLIFAIGKYLNADNQSLASLLGYLLAGIIFGFIGLLVGALFWFVRRLIIRKLGGRESLGDGGTAS